MKFVITFAFLIAGLSALPQLDESSLRDERLITNQIIKAINDLAKSIREAGLDPLVIEKESREYALPVPVLFNAAGYVEDVLSTGLSNIRINRMNFNVITTRLTFDLELPKIHFSVGDAYGEATIFGRKLQAEAAGSVDINSIRVAGNVQVSVGIISGISIRNLSINFTLGSINSNLAIAFQEYNLSSLVNTLLGTTIPTTLAAFRSDIDRLLEIVVRDLIEANL